MTVISVAIIVASVIISAGGSEGESSGETSQTTTSATRATTTVPPRTETTTTINTTATSAVTEVSYDEDTAEQIIATALSLVGTEFCDGGDSPDTGFDNSGFIYYVLRDNGYITCPRGVTAQAEMGSKLTYEELKKGDLVFFSTEDFSSVGYGGIYCGNGRMIACLMPGTQVKEINIESEYYQTYFSHGVSIT